jgi:hypothetical protein
MKKVFSISELPHVWASQRQDEGRTPNGSMYFYKGTIYSYGNHFPIAEIRPSGSVLMTWRGYSVSTAKHVSKVRAAISHRNVAYCYNPQLSISDNLVQESMRLRAEINIIKNKRTRPHTKDNARIEIDGLITNAKHYCEIMDTTLEHQLEILHGIPEDDKQSAYELFMYSMNLEDFDYEKAVADREERMAKLTKKRDAEILAKNQVNLAAWLEGEQNSWMLRDNITPLHLRVSADGTQIETTKGAKVSYESAKALYMAIQTGADVRGFEIDGYKVISNESVLKIGCHDISPTEVERFASTQKWNTIKARLLSKLSKS